MLLESVSHRGSWWVAGSAERLPGLLEYSPERGALLTLDGSFEPKNFRSFGGTETRHQIILGTTSLGKNITLQDCVEETFVIPLGYDGMSANSTYRVRLTFIGELFDKAEDIRFTTFYMRAPNLTAFVGTTGLRSGPPSAAAGEHNLTIAPAEEFSFHLDDFQVATHHQQVFGRPRFNHVSVTEEVVLAISAPTPRSLDDFVNGPGRSLHTLLELVSDGPLPMSEWRAISPGDTDVTILRSQRRPRDIEEVSQPELLPFTLKSLANDRDVVLARWHDARKTIGPTFDLYFSVMRHSDMPVEHQFIFLVQAVESFHRRRGSNEVDTPGDHERRVLDIFISLPKRLHEWLGRVIGDHSNEPRLAQRLREVHDLMPPRVQMLLGDKKGFARLIADTRNYLTHFDDAIKPRALTSVGEVWGGTQQLAGVLKLLFIQTLGLDQTQVLETKWGNELLQRLQQAARLTSKPEPSE